MSLVITEAAVQAKIAELEQQKAEYPAAAQRQFEQQMAFFEGQINALKVLLTPAPEAAAPAQITPAPEA